MPLLGAGYTEVVRIIAELREKVIGRPKKIEESLRGLSKANQTLMLASRQLGVDMATVQKGLSIQGLTINKSGQIVSKFTGKMVDQNKAIVTAGRVTKRFRMELLSVLFFGMALSRLFGAITKPAYEAVGAFELWNTTLMLTALGPAEKVGEAMDMLAEKIEKLPQPMQNAIGWTAVFGQGLGVALMQVGQFTLGILGMKLAFPSAFAAMTKSVVGLNHALLALALNPWFWLIGISLFLLYLSFNGYFDGIKEKIQGWLDWFIDKVYNPIRGFFTESIPEALETLKDWFSERWEDIKSIVSTVWKWIREHIINPIIGFFTETIPNALGILRDWFSNRLEDIKSITSSAWNWIKEHIVDPLINFFTEKIPEALRILKGWFSERLESIRSIFSTVYNWLKDHIWNPLIDFFTVKIPEAARAMKESVTKFVSDMWEGIKSAFKTAINFLIGLAESLANAFIKSVNFIIGAINKISFTIPEGVPFIGGKSISINIPTVPEITIPRLDDFILSGGKVYKTNPLDTIVGSKNFGMGNSVTIQNPVINISSVVGRDSTDMIVREVIEKLGIGLMRAI